jgi:hypothetical protein
VSFTTRTAPLPSSTRAPGHSPAATGRVIGSVCPAVDAPTDRGCTDEGPSALPRRAHPTHPEHRTVKEP